MEGYPTNGRNTVGQGWTWAHPDPRGRAIQLGEYLLSMTTQDEPAILGWRRIDPRELHGSGQAHSLFHRCETKATAAVHDRHFELEFAIREEEVVAPFCLQGQANA